MTADARRFGALWRRTVASPPSPDADAVYADLLRRLDGDDRRFHNLQHIADCLDRFDDVASLLDDRDAVEMGLWFHDAVYVPGDPVQRTAQRGVVPREVRGRAARCSGGASCASS